MSDVTTETRAAITEGRTALGIELGSTRIKAVLIGPDHAPLAVGSHDWQNQFVDRLWTYAIDDVCTHDGGPLAEGEFSDGEIRCPRHGARFDVRTGKALSFPAIEPVATHRTEVRGDDVYVALDES